MRPAVMPDLVTGRDDPRRRRWDRPRWVWPGTNQVLAMSCARSSSSSRSVATNAEIPARDHGRRRQPARDHAGGVVEIEGETYEVLGIATFTAAVERQRGRFQLDRFRWICVCGVCAHRSETSCECGVLNLGKQRVGPQRSLIGKSSSVVPWRARPEHAHEAQILYARHVGDVALRGVLRRPRRQSRGRI